MTLFETAFEFNCVLIEFQFEEIFIIAILFLELNENKKKKELGEIIKSEFPFTSKVFITMKIIPDGAVEFYFTSRVLQAVFHSFAGHISSVQYSKSQLQPLGDRAEKWIPHIENKLNKSLAVDFKQISPLARQTPPLFMVN